MAKDAALPAAGVFAKLAAGLVGLVVPAAVGAGLWTRVKSHPLDTVLLLVGYWLAMGLVALATGVGRELKAAWVPRLADAVDTAVMAAVYQRRKHYLRQLGDSVRDVETPGLMTQASHILRLQQVYVEVSLGAQPLQDTAAEPFVGRLPSPVEGRTLDTILAGDAHRVYAVIGGPGSGKTTLLRHTALELCERRRRGPLPVLLYLRDHLAGILADSGPGAVGLAGIATEAGWLRGKIPGQWLAERLDRGGCVVMLDGLDEVADEADRRSVVTWVNRQIERYPRNSFVITSRPAGYQSNPLGKADVLQVRRLSVEQISVFLHGWYYAINCRAMDETGERVRTRSTREADDLLERLRRQPALYDLAANPLLLTMIATVHRYRGALPGSRAALYGEMCQVLLHRRQEAKGLTDLETSLRGEQKEYVVQVLALYMMRNQIRDLPAKRICQVVRSSLAQTSSKVTPKQFLAEIHRSGLLVERENGVYSFAHLTLQEYLAAAQIRQSQRVDLLADRVDDPWWRETTLLWTAGDDATPVVKACLRKGTIRALALAFDCADEARGINTEVRRELDDLLEGSDSPDPARRKLITAVKVSRALREVIWLGDSTAVCARPVSEEIYSLFVRDQREQSRYFPSGDGQDGSVAADKSAVGMWRGDVQHFIHWLNNLFEDGTAFRLPKWSELDDPSIGVVIDPLRHSVWAQDSDWIRLYRRDDVPHPYALRIGARMEALTSVHEQPAARAALLLAVSLPLALAAARELSADAENASATGLATRIAHRLTLALVREPAHGGDFQGVYDLDLDLRMTAVEGLAADLVNRGPPRLVGIATPSSAVELLVGMLLRSSTFKADSGLEDFVGAVLFGAPAVDGLLGVPLQTQLAAYYLMLLCWTPSASRRVKEGQLLQDFEKFVKGAATESPFYPASLPDELVADIKRVERSLAGDVGTAPNGPRKAMTEVALTVIQGVRELVTPIVERTSPYDPSRLAAASIGLAGVMIAATSVDLGDFIDRLANVLRGLCALHARESGDLVPNEVLVLVRA